jgi:hypothetical protein
VIARSIAARASGVDAPASAAPAQPGARGGALDASPSVDPTLVALLQRVTLAELPEWTDRWYDTRDPGRRYFAIDMLMAELGLSRAHAAEIQNHYLDALRSDPGLDPNVAFERAVARAKAGEFEDRRALERLAAASVIVVFDLDETLYDQSIVAPTASTLPPRCSLLEVPPADAELERPRDAQPRGARRIALAPAWESAFDRIHAQGGVVVLFTANLDELTWANLRAWPWRSGSVLDHPAIAGVLTNSHLVRRSRHEVPSPERDDAAVGRRRPVWVEPSKDLRVLDESLARVVLVDDNPHRVAQLDRLRVLPKLDGDALCAPSEPVPPTASGGRERGRRARAEAEAPPALQTIVNEIEDSLRWARAHEVSFAAAHLPHTLMGRVLVDELQAAHGWSRARAIEWVRRHPSRVARDF